MRRIRPVRAALLGSCAASFCLLLAATESPPPASAGACGETVREKPRRQVNPGGRPPLTIGDSVMLFAVPNLARVGYRVNARGCRLWAEGLRLIRHQKRTGRIPHLVVVALGADWIITRRDLRRTLHVLGKRRVLGLVVPRETGGGSSNDARVIRRFARAHRKRVMPLDWVRFSRGHPGWFQPDGLHLTFAGASAYTKLIGKALRYASAGEFPRGDRFPG